MSSLLLIVISPFAGFFIGMLVGRILSPKKEKCEKCETTEDIIEREG